MLHGGGDFILMMIKINLKIIKQWLNLPISGCYKAHTKETLSHWLILLFLRKPPKWLFHQSKCLEVYYRSDFMWLCIKDSHRPPPPWSLLWFPKSAPQLSVFRFLYSSVSPSLSTSFILMNHSNSSLQLDSKLLHSYHLAP